MAGRRAPMLMSPRVLALLLLAALATCTPMTGLKEEREDLNLRVNCSSPTCRHTSNTPVCGNNGITYHNICELEKDICRGDPVQLKRHEPCLLNEMCPDARAFKHRQMANGEGGLFVPECLEDGQYAPRQCHVRSKFCWCANKDGSPIPGTIVDINKQQVPKCEEDRTVVDTPEPQKDQCSGRKRQRFLQSVMAEMVTEYKREHSTPRGRRGGRRGGGRSGGSDEDRATRFTFGQLDENSDGVLGRGEYSDFGRRFRRKKPKKCAKAFPKFCDKNGDGTIARREWFACFTKGDQGTNDNDNECSGKKCKKKPKDTIRPSPSCVREKEEMLAAAGNSSMMIPECSADGKYEPIQCYTDPQRGHEFCVCVDTETGNSIDGTGVRNGKPECRVWPGCMGAAQSKFLKGFQEYLVAEMNKVYKSEGVAGSGQSAEELAALYHFKRFDKNNNQYVDKNEKKAVRRFIQGWASADRDLRKCKKKLSKYCDTDNNRKISREEWVACVVTPDHTGNDTGNGSNDIKRRNPHENPILIYLRPEDEVVLLKYRNW